MGNKLTTEEFIARSRRIHGDKYNYSKSVYRIATEKVPIICSVHGEFLQLPHNHMSGRGCDKCSKELIGKNRRSQKAVEFVKKSLSIHGDRYNYEKTKYTRAQEKVTITCKTHGDFELLPGQHLNGQGCQKCSHDEYLKEHSYSTNSFIEAARKIHGNKYTYKKSIYKSSSDSLTITCPIHGDFSQTGSMHLSGKGCRTCGIISRAKTHRYSTEEFIRMARNIHREKYDYSKVNYVNSRDKVNIVCKKHNTTFQQSPGGHLLGYGCPACGVETVTNKILCHSSETFISRSLAIHGDKYDYSKVVYIHGEKKVDIICKKHNIVFQQTPKNHLKGQGCIKCSNRLSKREDDLYEFINSFFPADQGNRKVLKGKELDIYIPEKCFGIEYNGNYWHSEGVSSNTKLHMYEKQQACNELEVRLIHVGEYEDQKVIKKTLAHILGVDPEKYYARQCTVKSMSSNTLEVMEFLRDNHLQGNVKGCKAYALYVNNQIVACMLFSRVSSERGSKNVGRYELRRFSSCCRIVGGASRLLKAFIRNTPECESLISYSDNRWFTGNMYKQLGFTLVHEVPPDYKYTKGCEVQPKGRFRRKRLAQRKDIKFVPEETEKENAVRNGWRRLWDCGKKKWELPL